MVWLILSWEGNIHYFLLIQLYEVQLAGNQFTGSIIGVSPGFAFSRIEQTHLLKKPAEAKQDNFRTAVFDAAKPFLLARTDRFVNEVELFLASGLNIDAYDAVYMQRLGWNTPGGTTSTKPAEEPSQHVGVVPYLYIFDIDSDGAEWNFHF